MSGTRVQSHFGAETQSTFAIDTDGMEPHLQWVWGGTNTGVTGDFGSLAGSGMPAGAYIIEHHRTFVGESEPLEAIDFWLTL